MVRQLERLFRFHIIQLRLQLRDEILQDSFPYLSWKIAKFQNAAWNVAAQYIMIRSDTRHYRSTANLDTASLEDKYQC